MAGREGKLMEPRNILELKGLDKDRDVELAFGEGGEQKNQAAKSMGAEVCGETDPSAR